ncbi:MAG: glycosyltransferase family 2 protein [Pseudomonadota bacterium]
MNVSPDFPRFSVVVNNYNYGSYLEEALDSALNQLGQLDELIVVDDGSTDRSLLILKEYERNRDLLLIEQRNKGQMKAVRAGIAAARGDVVVLLDSDDYFLSGYLANLRKIYRRNEDVSFVFTKPDIAGKDSARAVEMREILDRMAFPRGTVGPTKWAALLFHEFVGVPTSGLSLRRSLADKIMSLPESIDNTVRLGPVAKHIFRIPQQEANRHGFSADGVIVRCASALGATKFYNDYPGFMYRIHGLNKYAAAPRWGRWYLRSNEKRLLRDVQRHFSIESRPTASELRDEMKNRSWAKQWRRKTRIRLEYCLAALRARGSIMEKLLAMGTAAGVDHSR